ncbi:MAG: cobyrinate a,c-diamide synthase [Humidesulfovibrio sp.]|uniref:cobyrinate a,c-diamide synthase n=1 Tax=Humidesulfovibrio sp. TaxID=2910988 RepID=UPI0027331832|nr:cobyrinate a,c-diamide synthase [Humidesulfovibrio sp.]MDP2846945.1 cobyrinate a,c-diamide synthase [Humidesulfovibrio sp.]
MPKALVLAGTHSGCGKTSATLGLLRALRRRGLRMQPFKAGPDFIDPGLHAAAAGTPSHNLDTWMQPQDALRSLFARHARGADVVVVEGVMGLFDGRSGADEAGSTAHLAKLLGLPALLVVDAKSQARSVAALAQGFARFDPGLRLAGVIFNRVGSARHEAILREAMDLVPGVSVLGCLRRSQAVHLPSRHLGLVTAQDAACEAEGCAAGLEATLEALADWVEQGVDISTLLDALPDLDLSAFLADEPAPVPRAAARSDVRIGVARDRAFCFLYEENLRLLAQAGAEAVFFSPLSDAALPEELAGLYLPGGYPELSGRELSANASMRASVRAFCAAGKPVWAECGGYMYLLEELLDGDGVAHALCGALPGRAVLRRKRAALGYREARTLAAGPLGPAGTVLRGHEFHYSEYEGGAGEAGQAAFALTASDGTEALDGQASGNIVGGYFHAHLASNPQAAQAFVAACRSVAGQGLPGFVG